MEHGDWYEQGRQAMSREIGMSTLTRKPLTEQIEYVVIEGADTTIVLYGTLVIREHVELTIDSSDPDFAYYAHKPDRLGDDPEQRARVLSDRQRKAKRRLLQAVIENDVTIEVGSE